MSIMAGRGPAAPAFAPARGGAAYHHTFASMSSGTSP